MKPTNNKYDESIDTKRRTEPGNFPVVSAGARMARTHAATGARTHTDTHTHRRARTRRPGAQLLQQRAATWSQRSQRGNRRRRQAAEKQPLRFSESLAGFDAAKQARQTRSLASDGDVTTGAVLVRDLFSPCASY